MQRLEGRSHQSRALEWGVVLLFILGLSWYLLNRYEALEARALATIARYEHQLLQTHLSVYRIRHGRYPPNLRTLVRDADRRVTLESTNAKRSKLFNDGGKMLDPYGRPYRYQPDSGELKLPQPLRSRPAKD